MFPQKESLFLVAPNFCRDQLLLNVVQFGAILCLQGHRLFECGNFSYWYGACRLMLILWLPRLSSSGYWFVLWLVWLRLFVNQILLTCTFGLSIICTNSVNQILLIYVSGFCIIICKNGMLIDWFPGHRNVWVDAIRVESRLPPPFLIKNWSLKWRKKLSTWHISSICGKKTLKIVYFYY